MLRPSWSVSCDLSDLTRCRLGEPDLEVRAYGDGEWLAAVDKWLAARDDRELGDATRQADSSMFPAASENHIFPSGPGVMPVG